MAMGHNYELVDPKARERLVRALRGMLGMTPPARKLYERLGYTDHGTMVQLFRIVRPLAGLEYIAAHGRMQGAARWLGRLPLERLRIPRPPFPPTVRPELVCTRDRPSLLELDRLFEEVAEGHRCIAERTGSFIDWRYWRCPRTGYGEYYLRDRGRLTGYAFTKLFLHPGGMKVGVISDLLVAREDREGMAALLGTATHDLERAGGDVLKCTFTPLWARRVAERFGFLDPKRFLPPTRWPGRRVFSAPGPVPLPTSLEDGWLTRGDSEMDFNDAVRGSTMLDPAPF